MRSPSGYVAATMAHLEEGERLLAQARMEAWALLVGVTPYSGQARRCLARLGNPRHRCGRDCYQLSWPDALDHLEWWRGPRGEFVLTAHPYGVSERKRRELDLVAARFGALLTVDPSWSWYWPGVTTLVVLWGRPAPSAAPGR